MQMKALAIAIVLALAGCATTKEVPGPVVDTFCITAKKRTWDYLRDSPETIQDVDAWNRAVDRRCAKKVATNT